MNKQGLYRRKPECHFWKNGNWMLSGKTCSWASLDPSRILQHKASISSIAKWRQLDTRISREDLTLVIQILSSLENEGWERSWHFLKVTEIASSRTWIKTEIHPSQPSSFQLYSYLNVEGPPKTKTKTKEIEKTKQNSADKYNLWHWFLFGGSVALQKRKGLLYNYWPHLKDI